MLKLSLVSMLVFFLLLAIGCNSQTARTDAVKAVIADGMQSQMLGDKFQFTEGPLWLPDKQALIFSDIPANKMYMYQPGKGFSVYRDPSHFSNGSALDGEGNMITTQHDRTITKTDKDGKVTVIAREYNGKKLNSPNDLAISKNGYIYFSDPHFGLIGYGPEKAPEEQPVRGIYRLMPDGKIELLSGDLKIPNGLVFSPNESILYATNTDGGTIHCFDVKADGTLSNPRLFARQPAKEGRGPIGDGIKIDRDGNVYAASPNGVAIYDPNGKVIREIELAESASNMAWGGKDYKTLFITAHNKVYSIETLIGGIPFQKK